MPINTDIQVPFVPQTGITQSILQALQLANEAHAQRMQQAIQQQQANTQQQQVSQQGQQVPSEIAQRQAETSAIPQRLLLQKQQIDAETELRKATLDVESKRWMGMLGVAQDKEARESMNQAKKLELDKFNSLWQSKLANAKVQGIQGTMALRQEALGQVKDLEEQKIALTGQANALKAKGLDTQADAVNDRAADMDNHIGVIRSLAGDLGLAPEVQVPQGTPKKAAAPTTPARPSSVPSDYIFKNGAQGVGWYRP
jgi:hypothetical protein